MVCEKNLYRLNQGEKTMKCSEYEQVSEALYQWFCVQKDKGTPVSGPILQKKGTEML